MTDSSHQIKWVVTNNSNTQYDYLYKYEFIDFKFYTSLKLEIKNDIIILIEGYVLPRFEYEKELAYLDQYQLVVMLYNKHKDGLITYIKGIFNLLIIDKKNVLLFNDHMGLSKFFIHNIENKFLLSNDINLILKKINIELVKENVVIFSLFQHFIDGYTMFRNVRYSKPATCIQVSDLYKERQYWNWKELMNLNRYNIPFHEFGEKFRLIIDQYINYLKPKKISMTLTGGRDTRTILSVLLNLNHIPDTFTFGNPFTADVISSREIADHCNLQFTNYAFEPTGDWYHKLSEEIAETGQSLIHIHRAHRLESIKKEKERDPSIDMVFVGSMGGDYIKGAHLDDYIISEFVRQWWFEKKKDTTLLEQFLNKYFLNNDLDILAVLKILNSHEFVSLQGKELEFGIVHTIIGSLHDYQDIALFQKHIKYCIVPFMDIDFLYCLFGSHYSLYDNFQTSDNPFKKMRGGDLQCNIIKQMYPELAGINFAQPYSPNDLLGNPLLYLIKRTIEKLIPQKKVPGFPYNSWFIDFVNTQIKQVPPEIAQIFDIRLAKKELQKSPHPINEGYWHKYSNIIMLSYYLNYYKNLK